jgi:hypothetical protein
MVPVLAAPFLLLLAAFPGDPFRDLPFEKAIAAARNEKKLLVLDFRSASSEASQRLDTLTFPESRVRTFLTEKVVAIRVDLDPESELARRFHVQSAPTIVFVDPGGSGTEIDRAGGYLEPRSFLSQARDTLAGRDALFRARARVAANAKSPRLHLELAQLLLGRGIHSEALEQLLWCFDHGPENDPSFTETRSNAVLTEILRLGQAYPTALEELAHRSDAAGARILKGSERAGDIADVILLDEKLARLDRLTAIYDSLRQRPERIDARRQLAPHVLVVLLTDRRYADALECVGDPAADLEKRMAACAEIEKKGSPAPDPALDRCRRETVRVGSEYCEILLGVGKSDSAAAIVELLLAFDPRVGTYAKLMESAVRAGASLKAAEMGRRGIASKLPPADKVRLKILVSELPER